MIADFEIVDPDDVEGPIDVVPEVWDDEKPHELGDGACWCEPRIEGKYVHHRSVFDAIQVQAYLDRDKTTEETA